MKTTIKYSVVLWISLLVLVFCLIQCTREDKSVLSEDLRWLQNSDNFRDSTYEQVFQEQLHIAESKKKWIDAASAYSAKGAALDYYLVYDSTYVEQCKTFYLKHGMELVDSFRVLLPYFIGSQYDFTEDLDQSDHWLKRALANCPDPYMNRDAGGAFMILSSQKEQLNELDSSQYYAYEALEVFKNRNEPINLAAAYHAISLIKTRMNDLVGANVAIKRMLQIASQENDTLMMVTAYTSYASQLQSASDTSYHKIARAFDKLMQEWSDPIAYFEFYSAFFRAHIFLDKENLKEAKKQLILAERALLPEEKEQEFALAELKVRYNYLSSGDIAEDVLSEIIARAIADEKYRDLTTIFNLGEMERKSKGDYKMAYQYLKNRVEYEKINWNADLRSELLEYEKKYETAKKEKQIVEQRETILKRNTTIGYLGGAMALLLLTGIVYSNRRRRKLAEKEQMLQEQFSQDLLQNTEDERSRIAGDLHDSVNHNLLTLKQKTETGQNVTKQEIEDVIQQVRSISYNLYPSMFEEVGLQKSIEELCRKVMEVSDIQIVTQIDYIKTLGAKQELQIYRIVEEALNNIIKHSEATHAMVRIKSDTSRLDVSIKDNGKGVDDDILSGDKITFGMANIKQRAKSIRGRINLLSDAKGTQLKLTVNTQLWQKQSSSQMITP